MLKQISFSAEFTPETLEAMIYLSAPPAKPVVEESPKQAKLEQEELQPAESFVEGAEIGVMRGVEREKSARDGNRLLIGGMEFMRVPAGKFIMGSKDDNEFNQEAERPQHTVGLNYDYWMTRFILTNEQYAEYLGNKKHPVSDWQKKKDHPVVNVTWDDAMTYCKWFNENFKSDLGDLLLRLPTEAEWEKAARGAYANEWPWGNEFDKNKCNSSEGGKGTTTSVGLYSAAGGDSPYGCADMVGNVWEWTHSLFMKYPYAMNDGREDEASRNTRVLRGGSFNLISGVARCAYRSWNLPLILFRYVGFRVVVSPIVSL